MNQPLRRVALALHAAVLRPARQRQLHPGVPGPSSTSESGNPRVLLDEYSRAARARSWSRQQPVAYSVDDQGRAEVPAQVPRRPTCTATVTGYYSFIYGRNGHRAAENEVLAGTDDRLFVRRVVDLVTTGSRSAAACCSRSTRARSRPRCDGLRATRARSSRIDPQTGAILAMVNNPSYDPNLLATHDGSDDPQGLDDADQRPEQADAQPRDARALPAGLDVQAGHHGGGALVRHATDPDDQGARARRTRPAADRRDSLPNCRAARACSASDRSRCARRSRISCNTAFADARPGARRPRRCASRREKFGFDSASTCRVTAASRASSPTSSTSRRPPSARSASSTCRATPLQMAMVSAGIANGGVVMQPYLVAGGQRVPTSSELERDRA